MRVHTLFSGDRNDLMMVGDMSFGRVVETRVPQMTYRVYSFRWFDFELFLLGLEL